MSRRRFFVPRESIRDGVAPLPSDQAHHLRNVLRLRTGDVVEIFDGKGGGYTGEVDFQDGAIFVRGLQSIATQESQIRVILAAALIKSSKYEFPAAKSPAGCNVGTESQRKLQNSAGVPPRPGFTNRKPCRISYRRTISGRALDSCCTKRLQKPGILRLFLKALCCASAPKEDGRIARWSRQKPSAMKYSALAHGFCAPRQQP